MAYRVIVVKARRDPEAKVWFVESSDLPGLNVEADTLEQLEQQLSLAVADLISEGNLEGGEDGYDIPIEVIAHTSTRAHIAA